MLTRTVHPFAMIAILSMAVTGPIMGNTHQAQAADGDMVLQVAKLSGESLRGAGSHSLNEREYHQGVADQVKGLIYQELTVAERKALSGTTATIEVKYTNQGNFAIANVVSSGMNKLATTVHRKMVWKSFPDAGKQTVDLTTAKMKVDIDKRGEIQVKLDLI
jgi:hypothetical protein